MNENTTADVEPQYDYFEDAIEPEERDIETKALFPSKTTFKGRRWDQWNENSREKKIKRCTDTLVITHNDADGLVSGALFKDFFKEEIGPYQGYDYSVAQVVEVDYDDIESVFNKIAEHGDTIESIYVSDLNLDRVYPVIEDVVEMVESFVWLDHHEWGEKQETVEEMGVEMVINTDRCAAGIVLKYLKENGYEPPEKAGETVRLTEDHDLWNHEMETIEIGNQEECISKVFSNLAFFSDSEKFMRKILSVGTDFLDYEGELLRDSQDEGFLANRADEHIQKVEYILENETRIEEINGYSVAFAYGRASPGELIDRLDDADILVHTKPMYPAKISLRGTESFERCHEIAEALGGGGHEKAAGCTPGVAEEPLRFLDYLNTHGEPGKRVVRNTMKELL